MSDNEDPLRGVHPSFRSLIEKKTVKSVSVKLGPGIGKSWDVPPTPVAEFFKSGRPGPEGPIPGGAGGRSMDNMTFSDGSSYCDQGGKERYKPAPGEEARCEALGLKLKETWYFL
mmetsp:Transcript_10421/g.36289  ORF Transcript_10421/g.36289 Transcript_10421/m.36289 type:complete len:115 (-) Transcript_10421:313-657(-)